MNAGKNPRFIRVYHGKTPGVKLHYVSNKHYRFVPPDRMPIFAFFQIGGNQGKKSIGTELDAIQVCIACNASEWLICVKAVQPNSLQIFCAQAGVWSF